MKDLILNELNRLKGMNYRNGFNDSVLSHVCCALGNKYEAGPAKEMWSAICCGNRNYIAETYGQDVQDLYNEVDEMAKGEGAFVMPEWGTRGT